MIEEQAGTVVLTDLRSRTGVFVRIRGEQELSHGDEMLVGRTRLVVDLVEEPGGLGFWSRRALGRWNGAAHAVPRHKKKRPKRLVGASAVFA